MDTLATMLAPEEAERLAQRNALIESLIPLARSYARQFYARLGLRYDDALSAAYEGAIYAVDHFDATLGGDLMPYARATIKGKIYNAMRTWDIVPERVRYTIRRVEVHGETPGPAYEKARALVAPHASLSLDAPLPYGYSHPSTPDADPAKQLEAREDAAYVARLRSYLPAAEAAVVHQHYDLGLSIREIARRMNLSGQRVSQLHSIAIARMRAYAS